MIRILDRMIARSFIRIFAGFAVGAPILFLVGDFVENGSEYLEDGISAMALATAYMYKVPQFLFWALPIASLIAAVFTIHSMTIHREILAAKAGGWSFRRLMVPIAVLGLLLSGAALPLSELVPIGEYRAALILDQMNIDRQWRNNFVFRTDDGGALAVQRLTLTDDRMSGITLSTPLGDGSTRYIMADEAYFSEATGWTFHNGYMRDVHPDGPDRATAYDSLRTTSFRERPEGLIDQVALEEEQMTRAQLEHLAQNIERSGGDSKRLRLELKQRISLAFASFVIVLFGGPLATSSRRGGNAYGIGIALGTTMLYILLMRLSGAFGAAGTLTPSVAAWLPNAIFLTSGVWLLARVRT